jgi:hypothetical protein
MSTSWPAAEKSIQDAEDEAVDQLFAYKAVEAEQNKTKCRGLKIALAVLVVLVIITIITFTILYYAWLPGFIQDKLDNTVLEHGSSTFYDAEVVTIKLLTVLHPSYTGALPVTLHSSLLTFYYCKPGSDEPCNDSDEFGTIQCPTLKLDKDKNNSHTLNDTMTVTNMDNFKAFSGQLFGTPNVTLLVKAKFSVSVDFGFMEMTVHDRTLSKNLTMIGMQGLPGTFLTFVDFYVPEGEDQPVYVNTTASLFNPGTSSFLPLGTTRWQWFLRSDTIGPLTRLAVVSTPNLNIVPDHFLAPTFGAFDTHPDRPYISTSRFFSDLVYGQPVELIALCTSTPCCFNNNSVNCSCVPASDIPLFSVVMEGAPLLMDIPAGPRTTFILNASASQPKRLSPGSQSPFNILWKNPWGAAMVVRELVGAANYQGVDVLLFELIPKVVTIPPYSTANSLLSLLTVANYTQGSPEEETVLEFIQLLQAGTEVATVWNGSMTWEMGTLPILLPIYTQTFLL